ncbi:hypothetical protein ACVWYI_001693 [Bradyrhizobium sp. LB13.1]
MLSSSRYSSAVCASPPTGPRPQMVGVPTAAVKPESAQAAGELALERGEAGLLCGGLISFEQRF